MHGEFIELDRTAGNLTDYDHRQTATIASTGLIAALDAEKFLAEQE